MKKLIAIISILYCFAGCGVNFNLNTTYYRPSGDGKSFVDSPHSGPIADSIRIPLLDEAALVLKAEPGVFAKDGRGYTDEEGITLFGRIYVPRQHRAKFQSPFFIIKPRNESNGNERAAIAKIERYLFWQTKRGSGVSMEIQSLSVNDYLVGWAPDDVLASGLVPPTSYVREDDLQNEFHFFVPFKGHAYSAFEIFIPAIEINGKKVPEKSVRFETVTEKHVVGISN